MMQRKGKMVEISAEQAAQLEQYQKLIKGADDVNTSFTLLDSKVTSSTDLIKNLTNALAGSFTNTGLETFSNELDKLSSDRAKLLGITKGQSDSVKESLASSYGMLSEYGIKFGEIADAQNLFVKEFNTNSKFSDEQTKTLLLTSQATGIETEKLVHNFREAGMGIEQMNNTMQTTMDYARSIGVASSAVLQKVTENIGKLNLFNFSEGEKGLAKMAAQSAVLGIDMSKSFQLSENLLDPQKAIDLSASLQRLGVTSSQLLDPLRAMDLAQNDPAELQNQMVELSKQFVKTKEDGSFEILPGAKRQLREVAQALGMNADELASMGIKSAEAAKKLQGMRFPEGFTASDEQKQLIANMANLGKGGQYEVEITREEKDDMGHILRTFTEKKNVSELDPEDLKALEEQSKPIKLEDLGQKQLTELQLLNNKISARTNARLVGTAASGVITQANRGASNLVDRKIKEMAGGETNQQTLLKTMNEIKETMKLSEEAKKIESGEFSTGEFLKYIEVVGGEVVKQSGKNMADAFKLAIKDIGGKNPTTDKMISALNDENNLKILGLAAVALTNLAPEISKLTDALKKLFKVDDAIIQGESSIISLGSGEVVIPDKKDKIAVGTNLDGMNNTTNLQETLTRKTPTVSEGMVTQQKVVMDLTPLTAVMSEYSKSVKPQTIDPLKLMDLSQTNSVELQNQMVELSKQFVKTKDDGSFEIPSEYKKQLTEVANALGISAEKFAEMGIKSTETAEKTNQMSNLDVLKEMSSVRGDRNNDDLTKLSNQETGRNLSLNTPKTVRETTVPTFNSPQLATMERQMSAPTQKVEFGKLEISLKVDIPNSANVNSDQIKQVLETTMNSTDFKQKLVGAVNEASSNFGQTSVGGTSNYGANKTNYSLNA
jgi:hypothetical protein